MDIKERFLAAQGFDNYQRIDTGNLVPLYVGLDSTAQYSLFCITKTPPKSITTSKVISVFVGERKDKTFGITFSLTDGTLLDLFVHFCEDLVEATKKIKDPSKAADVIMHRFVQWQNTFSKGGTGGLSFQEIKGLIGELCFLKYYMIPTFGENAAIDSWIGPDMADQDFVCGDTWYEVKSVVSGAGTVHISSVEQLDTQVNGHLVVVRLDKTSLTDSTGLSLNKTVNGILAKLNTQEAKDNLKTTLLRLGYYENEAYDQYCFHYNGMDKYSVTSAFPCARHDSFPPAVQHLKYELSLAAISEFKEN